VEQRTDRDDFLVMGDPLQLSQPDGKEPGSDRVVEEKRFGVGPG
jgi:hypothetical protein